jgi:hypothetical protein
MIAFMNDHLYRLCHYKITLSLSRIIVFQMPIIIIPFNSKFNQISWSSWCFKYPSLLSLTIPNSIHSLEEHCYPRCSSSSLPIINTVKNFIWVFLWMSIFIVCYTQTASAFSKILIIQDVHHLSQSQILFILSRIIAIHHPTQSPNTIKNIYSNVLWMLIFTISHRQKFQQIYWRLLFLWMFICIICRSSQCYLIS